MTIKHRHYDDLRGQLHAINSENTVDVHVRVSADHVHLMSVQHTAWMLLNLLARQVGIVRIITLHCPNVQLAGRIVPIAPRAHGVRDALLYGARAINLVPVTIGSSGTIVIAVGPEQAGFGAYGEGWCGGISNAPIRAGGNSPLPFGPYLAASLASAEVFRRVRLQNYTPVNEVFYSAWHHRITNELCTDGPPTLPPLVLDGLLAGVGAVGSTLLHVLWPLEFAGLMRVADNDPKGVTDTNLNRCPIYTAASLGLPKASHARSVLADTTFTITAHVGSWEHFLSTVTPGTRVLSAVDKNTVRSNIQDQYFGRVFQASTFELRAEVLRTLPEGPCLRCFSPPELPVPDDQLHEQLAQQSDRLAALCAEIGITVEDGKAWLAKPECGMTGEQLLPLLRRDADEPEEFSVGFVSVTAGALLAAELIKDHLAAIAPLDRAHPRAAVQFINPAQTRGAQPYGRDPRCPKCIPDAPTSGIWENRYAAVLPSR